MKYDGEKGNIIPNTQAYMKYADMKLREEEQRATKYLESCSGKYQLHENKSIMLIFHNMMYSIKYTLQAAYRI